MHVYMQYSAQQSFAESIEEFLAMNIGEFTNYIHEVQYPNSDHRSDVYLVTILCTY